MSTGTGCLHPSATGCRCPTRRTFTVSDACCFDEYDIPITADEILVVAGSPK